MLSYRRRRHLMAAAAVSAVFGGIATAVEVLPTAEKIDRGPTPPPTAPLAPPEHTTRLSLNEQHRLQASIELFVSSSVARNHPERSWPIVHPLLREGLTKRQWSAGNIPVVPYPAVGFDLLRLQSVIGQTALVEVVLEPRQAAHLARKTFQIELRRLPSSPHRWAVSSWVPEGISQTQMGIDARSRPVAVAAAYPQHLSLVWLFVPAGLFVGALILVPAFLLVRHTSARWRAKSRADSYEQSLGR